MLGQTVMERRAQLPGGRQVCEHGVGPTIESEDGIVDLLAAKERAKDSGDRELASKLQRAKQTYVEFVRKTKRPPLR